MSSDTTQPTPLFIFALPRSGSTLLQRILAAHPDVATVAEPHILLPMLFALRRTGVYAEYRHEELAIALEDFCKELPNGVDDYYAEVRQFALNLYAKADKTGARYFLDKTPSYHTIVEDVMRVFPEGRFIFLWRNPLAIAASCMESWNHGKWNLFRHKVDHFQGMSKLIETYERNAERCCAVRYEDLLQEPEKESQRIFDFLQLSFDPAVLSKFNEVALNGRMTDKTGTKLYQQLDREPLDKWKRTLANPIRIAWCRHYLKWLGQRRLSVMGYDIKALSAELDSIPLTFKRVGSDAVRMPYGLLYSALDLQIVKDKLKLRDWSRVIMHS